MIHIAVADAVLGVPERAALDVDQVEQGEAEQERPHRAPAEEVEGAQDEGRVDLGLELLGQPALERRVDEVEEVQVSDPGDARDHVEPAEDGLEGAREVGKHGAGSFVRARRAVLARGSVPGPDNASFA